jgi:hypothetical protein
MFNTLSINFHKISIVCAKDITHCCGLLEVIIVTLAKRIKVTCRYGLNAAPLQLCGYRDGQIFVKIEAYAGCQPASPLAVRHDEFGFAPFGLYQLCEHSSKPGLHIPGVMSNHTNPVMVVSRIYGRPLRISGLTAINSMAWTIVAFPIWHSVAGIWMIVNKCSAILPSLQSKPIAYANFVRTKQGIANQEVRGTVQIGEEDD